MRAKIRERGEGRRAKGEWRVGMENGDWRPRAFSKLRRSEISLEVGREPRSPGGAAQRENGEWRMKSGDWRPRPFRKLRRSEISLEVGREPRSPGGAAQRENGEW